MIEEPAVVVRAMASQSSAVVASANVDPEIIDGIRARVQRLSKAIGPTWVEIVEAPLQHSGFGTRTALTLAALRSSAIARGVELGQAGLVRLSGRGGTSGIGVNGFFTGGFIADGGHRDGPDKPFQPSRYSPSGVAPPLLVQLTPPPSWQVNVIVPPGRQRSGAAEQSFFARHTPTSRRAALEAIGAGLFEIPSAVAEMDLPRLRSGLLRLQAAGFKRAEIRAQSPAVRNVLSWLADRPSVAFGMSSFGPAIGVISRADDQTISTELGELAESTGSRLYASCPVSRFGHTVEK
jgi:beta-ribofuranosylaminobenzene 5'-phosphate synthase